MSEYKHNPLLNNDRNRYRNSQTVKQLTCNICKTNSVECEVHLIYKNRVVQKGASALKLENYAFDKGYMPSLIRFVYSCQKCHNERIMHERVYNDQVLLLR